MLKMTDRFTGVEMWVDDSKVEEYKAAGHKPAAEPTKETKKKKK